MGAGVTAAEALPAGDQDRVPDQWVDHHRGLGLVQPLSRNGDAHLPAQFVPHHGAGVGQHFLALPVQEDETFRVRAADGSQVAGRGEGLSLDDQVALARRRKLDVEFFVGDVTRVDLLDDAFDGAFIFGVLRHIPHWPQALREMARLLRPGGVLLVEEPRARFDWPELERGIEGAGFKILEESKVLIDGFHSYLCQRPAA
jgi:ubiquinone/menaquinone biosynthesis C-methylase UbiE